MEDFQVSRQGLKAWPLWTGIGWWGFALLLTLLQAQQEAVRWATPYGLTILRTLIVPIFTLLSFYAIAILVARRPRAVSQPPRTRNQIFFLLLVFALTYWAAVAPLRHNWILLLGTWMLIPSLFLSQPNLIARTTLLSLTSIVFSLIAFEILLQPFPQLWPGYARMVGSNWRRIHADIPTLEYDYQGVTYQINALGFRGSQPVPDDVDIVALGDSNTFGVGSREPWPEQLAEITNSFVMNLGMGGTDPPKHVYPLIAYGIQRHPEFVIETYFEGNDLFSCYQPARPISARWGDNLILPDLIGGIKEMVRFLTRDDAITSELSYDIATPYQRTIAGQQVELTFSPAYAATLLLDSETILASENWRIASGAIQRMQEVSQSEDIPFILVYLPERTRAYWPLIREDSDLLAQLNQDMVYGWQQQWQCLTLVRGRAPADLEVFRSQMDAAMNAQRDLLQSYAMSVDIPFLDLTPTLQRLAAEGYTLADPLETHYNDFVNRVIAEEISAYLETIEP